MRRETWSFVAIAGCALIAAGWTSGGGDWKSPAGSGAEHQNCAFSIANPVPANEGVGYHYQLVGGRAQLAGMTGAPPGMGMSGGALAGTPTQAGSYTIHLTITFAHVNGCADMPPATRDEPMTVIHDPTPPTISSFTVSVDTLPANGGDVSVTVAASDNVMLSRVVSSRTLPDGTGNSGILQLTQGTWANGTWTLKWSLPPNASATPASYVFKAWALDASRNETRAATSRTVVVSGHPRGLPMLRH